jgi:hypothetical protein
MNETTLNGIALILLLIPFALISIGTTNDIEALWWAGVIMLIIGALIPPISRYVFTDENDE